MVCQFNDRFDEWLLFGTEVHQAVISLQDMNTVCFMKLYVHIGHTYIQVDDGVT